MRLAMLSNSARLRGIMCWGSPGAGKTRFLGRLIVWQDFKRGMPTIVIDPIGTLSDQFLSKVSESGTPLDRIHYADMSGQSGYITPFPLYQRFHGETLHDTAMRFLDVIRLTDPAQRDAPIHGFNPLLALGGPLGMLFAVLGLSITEAPRLLDNTDAWKSRLEEARAKDPEVVTAVDFFLGEYRHWPRSLTQTLRNKISPFIHKPYLHAIVSPGKGIDWDDVVAKGKTVLIDLRDVHDPMTKSFLALWVFKHFQAFVLSRGTAYGNQPIGLYIDELQSLFGDPQSANGDSAFATEITQLINAYARNYRVSSVFASQDPLSFGQMSRQSLLGIGTHIIGPIANTDNALLLARSIVPHNPKQVKHYQTVYGTPNRFAIDKSPPILDYHPQYYPLDEQVYITAQRLKTLSPFHFLVRPARSEGAISPHVYPIRIDHIDAGHWPDPLRVGLLRQELSRTCGVAVQSVTIQPDHSTLNPHDGHRTNHIPDADPATDDDIR